LQNSSKTISAKSNYRDLPSANNLSARRRREGKRHAFSLKEYRAKSADVAVNYAQSESLHTFMIFAIDTENKIERFLFVFGSRVLWLAASVRQGVFVKEHRAFAVHT
jgi:hypothetical protein